MPNYLGITRPSPDSATLPNFITSSPSQTALMTREQHPIDAAP